MRRQERRAGLRARARVVQRVGSLYVVDGVAIRATHEVHRAFSVVSEPILAHIPRLLSLVWRSHCPMHTLCDALIACAHM